MFKKCYKYVFNMCLVRIYSVGFTSFNIIIITSFVSCFVLCFNATVFFGKKVIHFIELELFKAEYCPFNDTT